MKTQLLRPLGAALLASVLLPGIHAQGTVFTYQGRLTDAGEPATGHYDLKFTLFSVPEFGTPIGGVITNTDLAISGGLFTAALDFGANAFTGDQRWLEIAVRTNGTAAFTPLTPRQPVTPTPYAFHAQNAGNALQAQTAGNALLLNGQSPAAYAPATGSPAYAPATGSPAYVAKAGDTMTGALVVNQDISAPRMIANGPPPEGGALTLRNLGKTGNAANAWELYNMTGVYGDSFQIWSYAADASSYGPRLILADDGTTVLGPSGGNVGIGTKTPTQELDVAGEVAAYQFIADASSPEGGRLLLRNSGKAATSAYEWALFNMSGDYGDSFQLWSYAADASWWGPMFVIYDTGTTVLAPERGNVGIGTGRAEPAAKLEVQGGPIKATGGLIIETRTDDPPNPVEGQIWLVK